MKEDNPIMTSCASCGKDFIKGEGAVSALSPEIQAEVREAARMAREG